MKKPQIEIIGSRRAEVVLKEAIEKGNWFEGVVLSKVYLEDYAIDRLRKYLASKQVHPRPFLIDKGLYEASEILLKLRIIDKETFKIMKEVNRYRNNLIHKWRSPDAIKPDEAKRIIEKTLECFESIVSSYESMKKKPQ